MSATVQEPLRDQVGRALYEEPGLDRNWYDLPEDRREPWRKDADRIIPIVAADYAAIKAEKDRALKTVDQLAEKLSSTNPFQ